MNIGDFIESITLFLYSSLNALHHLAFVTKTFYKYLDSVIYSNKVVLKDKLKV